MRRTIIVSCAFGFLVLCAGCSTTKVGVAARHAPVTAYEANEGHLNTPAYQVGDLVAMDPQTNTAWRVTSVPVSPRDLRYGQPTAGKTEPFTGKWFWLNVSAPENLSITVRGKAVPLPGNRPLALTITPSGVHTD